VSGYRGRDRGDGKKLVRLMITLPASLVTELDIVVTHYKQEDRGFNRGALVQEALMLWLEGLNGK
jgi:metal-responsive CopG/Arc/MetJ family transcriptional regulator